MQQLRQERANIIESDQRGRPIATLNYAYFYYFLKFAAQNLQFETALKSIVSPSHENLLLPNQT